MVKQKHYDAKLKASIALSAIRGEKSILAFCAEKKIPKSNVQDWRDKLIKEANTVFISPSEKGKQVKLLREEIQTLHKLIDEISIENNFLKKKLVK